MLNHANFYVEINLHSLCTI